MKLTFRDLLMGTLVLVALTLGQPSYAKDPNVKPWQPWREWPKAGYPGGKTVSQPTRPMSCSLCTDTTAVVKRQVTSKPGHGWKEVRVAVHQCPTCGEARIRKLGTKKTERMHICRAEDEAPNCCKTTRSSGRGA